MVVVHGFTPALAIRQEVSGCTQVFAWYVWRLEVDGVEPSDDAIVSQRHLRCNVVCRMGGLLGDVRNVELRTVSRDVRLLRMRL